MICKFIQTKNYMAKNKNLKNIILTSESVSKTDIELIKKYLGLRVINEYGMAEAGVIGYSKYETNNIEIFWDNYIIQSNNNKVHITTLWDKKFPLINYDPDDLVQIKHQYRSSILSLKSIEGKKRNILKVPKINGGELTISTIFFDHVLKFYPRIYSISYRQLKNTFEIILVSDHKLNLSMIKQFLKKQCLKDNDQIDTNKIILTQGNLEKTIAGKNNVLRN